MLYPEGNSLYTLNYTFRETSNIVRSQHGLRVSALSKVSEDIIYRYYFGQEPGVFSMNARHSVLVFVSFNFGSN